MDIERAAKELLQTNRRVDHGCQYTVPSTEHYPYQWLWDSCFHAIIYSQYDPEAAKKELISLLSKQCADGMVPHIIYWKPGELHRFRWGYADDISALTQPPMIAYAAWEIHRASKDEAFLESIYPALLTYYQFLITKRDPRGEHLVGIINPDESGEDNSPRFDGVLGCKPNVSYKEHHEFRVRLVDQNRENNFDVEKCLEHFWVKDVLFNTVLVENLRALGHIASLLKHTDGEQFANHNADLVAAAMREHLFEDGVYWSSAWLYNKKLRVATWAHFLPLFAGLYSPDEAAALIEKHFHNTETFNARYGIRTTSKKEPGYRAEGFPDGFSWRGPVWISPHWFLYRGLVRYGFRNEAQEIRIKSEALIEKSGFRECFNPDTGEGQGAHNFTWGALVLDMKDRPSEELSVPGSNT